MIAALQAIRLTMVSEPCSEKLVTHLYWQVWPWFILWLHIPRHIPNEMYQHTPSTCNWHDTYNCYRYMNMESIFMCMSQIFNDDSLFLYHAEMQRIQNSYTASSSMYPSYIQSSYMLW